MDTKIDFVALRSGWTSDVNRFYIFASCALPNVVQKERQQIHPHPKQHLQHRIPSIYQSILLLIWSSSKVNLLKEKSPNMKLLSMFTLYCAAASATPVSLAAPQGYSETREVNIFDNDQGFDDMDRVDSLADHHDSNEVRDIAIRAGGPKIDRKFEAVQRAAGANNELRLGNSYYFLSCNRWPYQPNTWHFRQQGEEASRWVHDKTKDKTPYGCIHTALVVGQVQALEGTAGCFGCKKGRPTFVGNYYEVVLDPVSRTEWVQKVHNWKLDQDTQS